jgi:hypothetical protein
MNWFGNLRNNLPFKKPTSPVNAETKGNISKPANITLTNTQSPTVTKVPDSNKTPEVTKMEPVENALSKPTYLINNKVICLSNKMATSSPPKVKEGMTCDTGESELAYRCNIPTIFSTPLCFPQVDNPDLKRLLPQVWDVANSINGESPHKKYGDEYNAEINKLKYSMKEYEGHVSTKPQQLVTYEQGGGIIPWGRIQSIASNTGNAIKNATKSGAWIAFDRIIISKFRSARSNIKNKSDVFNQYVEAAIKFNAAQQLVQNITEIKHIGITNLTEVITGLTKKNYKLTTLTNYNSISTKEINYTSIGEVSLKNKPIEKQFKLTQDQVTIKLSVIRNGLYVLWTIVKLDIRKQEESEQKRELLTKYKELSDLIESVDDHFKLIGELIKNINDKVPVINKASDKFDYNYLTTQAKYATQDNPDETPKILSLNVNDTMKIIVEKYNTIMKLYFNYYKLLLPKYITGITEFNKIYQNISTYIKSKYGEDSYYTTVLDGTLRSEMYNKIFNTTEYNKIVLDTNKLINDDLNISYKGVFAERERGDKPFEMCYETYTSKFVSSASNAALKGVFSAASVFNYNPLSGGKTKKRNVNKGTNKKRKTKHNYKRKQIRTKKNVIK